MGLLWGVTPVLLPGGLEGAALVTGMVELEVVFCSVLFPCGSGTVVTGTCVVLLVFVGVLTSGVVELPTTTGCTVELPEHSILTSTPVKQTSHMSSK